MKIEALKTVKNAVVSLKKGGTAHVQTRVGEQMAKNGEAKIIEQSQADYIKEREAADARIIKNEVKKGK